LVDADGVQAAVRDRARDLGRLLAELPAADPRLDAARQAYAVHVPLPGSARTTAAANRFRKLLAV
ncbi:MAG TPA: hypothetical protein VGC54_10980, partial [Planctomycetota bacterium]